MREGRGTYTCPVRADTAIADEVVAVTPLGSLNDRHRLSRRNDRTPADSHEVMNQRLDVVHGPRLGWRRSERMFRITRPSRHLIDTLTDDAKALPHLLNVNHSAVVAIAC